MNLLFTVVASVAVAHGLVVGYLAAHGADEPLFLKIVWRIASSAGLYAAVSFIVALAVFAIWKRWGPL